MGRNEKDGPQRVFSTDLELTVGVSVLVIIVLLLASVTDDENAIMDGLRESIPLPKYDSRDIPEGTITTNPYYTDMNVLVTLK